MKPLLGISVAEGAELDMGELAEVANEAVEVNFGNLVVQLILLTTEEGLRAFEAGELVLYKRRPRRVGNKIKYRRAGHEVELEQMTLLGE